MPESLNFRNAGRFQPDNLSPRPERRGIKVSWESVGQPERVNGDSEKEGRPKSGGGVVGSGRIPVEFAQSEKPGSVPLKRDKKQEKREQEIVMAVGSWLKAIFKRNLQENDRRIMQECFTLPNEKFSEGADMTIEQAARAYANYIMAKNPDMDCRLALDNALAVIRQETGVELDIPYLDEKPGELTRKDMRRLEKTRAFQELKKEMEGEKFRKKLAEDLNKITVRRKERPTGGGWASEEISGSAGEARSPLNSLEGPLDLAAARAGKEELRESVERVVGSGNDRRNNKPRPVGEAERLVKREVEQGSRGVDEENNKKWKRERTERKQLSDRRRRLGELREREVGINDE
jgi:hypothetical protein